MKSLVLYDSAYGNTEKVAQAIAGVLSSQSETMLVSLSDAGYAQLSGIDLLVVGSPTQAVNMTKPMSAFLKDIPKNTLKGVKVAAFDTRFTLDKLVEVTHMKSFLVRMFGYAAKSIADQLVKKGGSLVLPPEGFIVEDTEGPIREGELERAAEWAGRLLA